MRSNGRKLFSYLNSLYPHQHGSTSGEGAIIRKLPERVVPKTTDDYDVGVYDYQAGVYRLLVRSTGPAGQDEEVVLGDGRERCDLDEPVHPCAPT